jgi:phage gp29-like protein
MILDHNGQPIDVAAIREPQTARTGHLVREFDRHPARGLTPQRLAGILSQAEQGDLISQLELADDIEERDGHVYAELGKRKGAITGLEWDVHAPDGATPDEESLAAEVREWLTGLPEFADVLLGMMDACLKGFAMHEMVWSAERDGRRPVLRPRFTFQPQRMFTTSADRRTLMLRSLQPHHEPGPAGLPPVMAEPLVPMAWLAHVHSARSGYLTRNSLCRVLAWPYLFKNYAVRDLAEFLEIFGLPLRLGKYPTGASAAEKNTLLQAVVAIGHNAAGIIPQSMALEFQEAAKGSEGPFTAMWDRMEAMESKVILGQTLTAGEGQHGTQALGQVHNEVRMDIRNADARQLEQTLNAQLIRPYCLLNRAGADPRRLPRIVFDTGEAEDLKAYADNLPKLAGAGLRIAVDWAHKKLRIPQAEAGQEVLRATPAAAPGAVEADDQPPPAPGAARKPAPGAAPVKAPAPAPAARAALAAAPAQAAAPRDALDDLVDDATADWRPMLAPMVEPLLADLDRAVAAGTSLADWREQLPELITRMDSAQLAEQLARAAFVARLAGEADLDLDLGPQA